MVRLPGIAVVSGRITALTQRVREDEALVHSVVTAALVLALTTLLMITAG